MRRCVVILLVASCGRLGFEAHNGAIGDGNGSNQALHDAAPALSCSHYTTLDACRREAGCTPVICNDCPCEAPTMSGCIGRGDNALTACPATACAMCCRTQGDCNAAQYCLGPEQSSTCGACMVNENPCSSDLDCTASTCVPQACGCGTNTCVSISCTDDLQCAANEQCSIAGICAPRACNSTADCPPDFGCTTHVCVRKTCAVDADCSAFCVDGQCYSGRGTCMLQGI